MLDIPVENLQVLEERGEYETFPSYEIPNSSLQQIIEGKEQVSVFFNVNAENIDLNEVRKTEEFFNKKGYFLSHSVTQLGNGIVLVFQKAEG